MLRQPSNKINSHNSPSFSELRCTGITETLHQSHCEKSQWDWHSIPNYWSDL